MLSKNQVAEIRSLHQKKQRDLKNQFIVEGQKNVLELIQCKPGIIRAIYCLDSFLENQKTQLKQVVQKIIRIDKNDLERLSLQENPNMVLAVCDRFPPSNLEFNFKNYFSLYLDEIRDPGNLGTLIRLADWFGIKKIFCSEHSCEFYNPKVIQASMGAFLRVELVYVSLDQLIKNCKPNLVYGAVLDGTSIYKETLKPGLILIGNEANGITKENLIKINCPITIPSAGENETESLNAAMAAGIICAEFFRQLKVN